MAPHGRVHPLVQLTQGEGIDPEELGGQLGDARAGATSISGEIGGPEWANFTPTGKPLVGFYRDYGRVEDGYRVSPRPLVAALVEWEVDLVGADRGNLHRGQGSGVRAVSRDRRSSVPQDKAPPWHSRSGWIR